MKPLAFWLSASGRIAPRPFALAIVGVYLASFLSQILLAPPVTPRLGVAPFAILQTLVTWVWFALHARRLRDAGRPTGPAMAIAALYALAMVLLMLLVGPLVGPDASAVATDAPRPGFADVWVFPQLVSAIVSQVDLGFFDLLALLGLGLILTPVAIALGFSVWAGSRPSMENLAPAVP